MNWTVRHSIPNALDLLGFIPSFLDEADPRPAAEQFNDKYAHGGGWRPMQGWKLDWDNNSIQYPGDPAIKPVAFARLRDELILVYPHAWVVIVQIEAQPQSFEIARMD